MGEHGKAVIVCDHHRRSNHPGNSQVTVLCDDNTLERGGFDTIHRREKPMKISVNISGLKDRGGHVSKLGKVCSAFLTLFELRH